jgi:hypothetical protein
MLPWYEIEMVWEYYLKIEDTFPGFDTHDYIIFLQRVNEEPIQKILIFV